MGGGGDPSQPWPHEGERAGALKPAAGEGPPRPGGGREGEQWQPAAGPSSWGPARPPYPSGWALWSSPSRQAAQAGSLPRRAPGRGACTWVRGHLPLLPGQGLGRDGEMEAQAWAGCPAGLGPQGSGQWGATTAPQGMQKGPPFLLSPKFHHRRAVAPGMAGEPLRGGRVGTPEAACALLNNTDPGEAWAGLGRAVGTGPACPRAEGRLGPVRVGSAATELGPGGPLHANTVHWALTRTPSVASSPPILSGLTPPNLNSPEE